MKIQICHRIKSKTSIAMYRLQCSKLVYQQNSPQYKCNRVLINAVVRLKKRRNNFFVQTHVTEAQMEKIQRMVCRSLRSLGSNHRFLTQYTHEGYMQDSGGEVPDVYPSLPYLPSGGAALQRLSL